MLVAFALAYLAGAGAIAFWIDVRFPRGWLARNPLTRADLALEAGYLKAARTRLRFV